MDLWLKSLLEASRVGVGPPPTPMRPLTVFEHDTIKKVIFRQTYSFSASLEMIAFLDSSFNNKHLFTEEEIFQLVSNGKLAD